MKFGVLSYLSPRTNAIGNELLDLKVVEGRYETEYWYLKYI